MKPISSTRITYDFVKLDRVNELRVHAYGTPGRRIVELRLWYRQHADGDLLESKRVVAFSEWDIAKLQDILKAIATPDGAYDELAALNSGSQAPDTGSDTNDVFLDNKPDSGCTCPKDH